MLVVPGMPDRRIWWAGETYVPGLFWGLLGAASYAVMNLVLRATSVDADPVLGALVRAVPMTVAVWSTVLVDGRLGQTLRLGRAALLPLAIIGLLLNVSGNSSFQLALALVGLTITVPVSMSAVIWGAVGAGWLLMGERVSVRSALGLLALVAALPLLTSGGGGGTGPVWLGTLAAATAGLSYGIGNALLRRTILRCHLPQAVAIAPVTAVAIVSLTTLLVARHGPEIFVETAPATIGWLLVAGIFNAIAFLSLAKSLSLLPVSRASSLSTLQTALSAAGGVLFFAEPLTGPVTIGLFLTLVGAFFSQQRRPVTHARPTPAEPRPQHSNA
ncbi:MAG: DMT family transporter [Chloroflexi bacterium]|nr:DMT family transporter [Chloroflexota bacterium]